jgi:adenosylhomocysteinase
LASEWAVKNRKKLKPQVYDVPEAVDNWVARLKLASMGVSLDTLTQKQKTYLTSWDVGT